MSSVYRLVGWGYATVCAALVVGALSNDAPIPPTVPAQVVRSAPAPTRSPQPEAESTAEPTAAEWFRRVKPYCNSVEIGTVQRQSPPPPGIEGTGYHAACFALAGRIDDARRAIDLLAETDRQHAANIVFNVGHPVADAGDDRAAGPIMELVVDYIPSHYMALYHAGAAEYMLGQFDLAKKNLTEFLRYYPPKDGWRTNAEDMLSRLANPAAIAADPRRPREP